MSKLYEATDNQIYVVKSIPNAPLLRSLGVFEGARITKQATYRHGGPALVSINSREVAIGKDLAVQINVERE